MHTTADYLLVFTLAAPFVAWFAWMLIVLPLQAAVEAYRHRGGRLPQPRGNGPTQKPARRRNAEPQPAEDAPPPEPSVDDDRADRARRYWVTGTYDPQRYHSYSKWDLEIMRTFGMDGDSYDANGSSLGERD